MSKTWLIPFSLLYGTGVAIRHKLFDWKVLRSEEYDIPVICVGNLTVGGTGKTPMTEMLAGHFKKTYNVAILSRGYKRRTKGYVEAEPELRSSTWATNRNCSNNATPTFW